MSFRSNPSEFALSDAGYLPHEKDNCALAVKKLDIGTRLITATQILELAQTVPEGHRFAIQSIAEGENLTSWSMPFGVATTTIQPGDYVCNTGILNELRTRELDFQLPYTPNFRDSFAPYTLGSADFVPGRQVARLSQPRTFFGYERPSSRGTGTRNYIVLLATSSRASSFVRVLADELHPSTLEFPDIDGVVPIFHTEGGGSTSPNNQEYLIRTLAGFMVHPNVGAVLAVDSGSEAVTNSLLRDYLSANDFPLRDLPHSFLSLNSGFERARSDARTVVSNWLEVVNSAKRSEQGLSGLRVALQCGGSDSFSGVSANPLVAAVALELIRHHGSINLAETVELVGAEDYLLKNVRDRKTALKFLSFVEDFKERMAWHGHSPEGNPSGGNRYRGLYNIVIKSLGAAMKRHPEVCLDYAIDYSERMENPGFYFMNSPGNDLESIAGQVASGVNLIFFTTGSGSVTNFPFVPTLKVLSTTSRYNLLPNDIDVNAGLLFEGIEMEKLVEDMFELTIRTASGAQCLGEKSGHHQVSIWRNWFQRSSYGTTQIVQLPELDRKPLLSSKSDTPQSDTIYFTGLRHENCLTTDQIGLVLPTSLCSSHVARRIASHLNEKILNKQELLSSFLSLDHTEGCGVSEGSSQDLLVETLIGYLTHPRVRFALLIEHGCEKVHNNLVKQELIKRHLDPSRFGWMSIQLDGGVEAVAKRVEDWFLDRVTSGQRAARVSCGLGDMRLAMLTEEAVVEQASVLIPKIAKQIVEAGGTVVVPGSDRVLESDYFWKSLDLAPSRPTIPYGSRILDPGLYLMDTPTRHWVELLTGLGASGAETIVALAAKEPRQGHPLIPTLQVGFRSQLMNTDAQKNFDLVIPGNELEDSRLLLERIALVMSREYVPKAMKLGNTDFQMTRGFFGVSV